MERNRNYICKISKLRNLVSMVQNESKTTYTNFRSLRITINFIDNRLTQNFQ